MTDINEKYGELLRYFNVYPLETGLLETKSYVSMDDIHNAILIVGVNMESPVKHYIIKSKQMAINEFNAVNRHYRIVSENVRRLIGNELEFDVLGDYNFTENELDLIMELMSGVKAYKSAIPRRQYTKLLDEIRLKVRASL